MIAAIDPIAELTGKIRKEIAMNKYAPGQKLLSERKLAKLYKTTPNRVHRAIQQLVRAGELEVKTGNGTFIKQPEKKITELDYPAASANQEKIETGESARTSAGNLSSPELYQFFDVLAAPGADTLKIFIAAGNDASQRQLWLWALKCFHEIYPFIDAEVDFGLDIPEKGYDLILLSPLAMRKHRNEIMPIPSDLLDNAGIANTNFVPGAFNVGQIGSEQCGVPLLRTPTVIYANRKYLSEYGIFAEKLHKPLDMMKAADTIEKKSEGKVLGIRYFGFSSHAAMYGIVMEAGGDNLFHFDRKKMIKFLSEFKPCIKHHNLKPYWKISFDLFLEGRYAIFPDFLFRFPAVAESSSEFALLNYPRMQDGFAHESMILGCIGKTCQDVETVLLLLKYLSGKSAQREIVKNNPHWLSVIPETLAEQKDNSPFPSGSVVYDFDPRSYYSQTNPAMLRGKYTSAFNTEIAKFFSNVHDMETTISNLEKTMEKVSEKR